MSQSNGPRIDKMTITYERPGAKKRKPPRQQGDRKMIKGVEHICVQSRTSEGYYLVNRGKPVLEWQPYSEYLVGRRVRCGATPGPLEGTPSPASSAGKE
jgi:hypothetical protein